MVSHEEFTGLPTAKIIDRPTVKITDWFVELEKFSMETLQYAGEIVFIDERGSLRIRRTSREGLSM